MGIPQVGINQLPPEVQTTVNLIAKGWQFTYPKDGTEFKNREGLLPIQPPGYYREYTVEISGVLDRGSRRLITGKNGELYYTPDHYNSFQEII